MDVLWLVVGTVVALNAYAVLLIVVRPRLYRVRLYRPMLLNVGLSVLPLLVSVFLVLGAVGLTIGAIDVGAAAVAPYLVGVFFLVATGVWVLFFPNAVYLITELNMSHRRADDPVPLWFDIVATLTLTLSGIANAVSSLGVVQVFGILLLEPNAEVGRVPPLSWVVAVGVLVLGSVGIYLGRYLRFNSWDVKHPSSMLAKTRNYFAATGRIADAGAFVLAHTLLMSIIYVPSFSSVFAVLGT